MLFLVAVLSAVCDKKLLSMHGLWMLVVLHMMDREI